MTRMRGSRRPPVSFAPAGEGPTGGVAGHTRGPSYGCLRAWADCNGRGGAAPPGGAPWTGQKFITIVHRICRNSFTRPVGVTCIYNEDSRSVEGGPPPPPDAPSDEFPYSHLASSPPWGALESSAAAPTPRPPPSNTALALLPARRFGWLPCTWLCVGGARGGVVHWSGWGVDPFLAQAGERGGGGSGEGRFPSHHAVTLWRAGRRARLCPRAPMPPPGVCGTGHPLHPTATATPAAPVNPALRTRIYPAPSRSPPHAPLY